MAVFGFSTRCGSDASGKSPRPRASDGVHHAFVVTELFGAAAARLGIAIDTSSTAASGCTAVWVHVGIIMPFVVCHPGLVGGGAARNLATVAMADPCPLARLSRGLVSQH